MRTRTGQSVAYSICSAATRYLHPSRDEISPVFCSSTYLAEPPDQTTHHSCRRCCRHFPPSLPPVCKTTWVPSLFASPHLSLPTYYLTLQCRPCPILVFLIVHDLSPLPAYIHTSTPTTNTPAASGFKRTTTSIRRASSRTPALDQSISNRDGIAPRRAHTSLYSPRPTRIAK